MWFLYIIIISGISGKSQFLFLIVYLSRYLEIFTTYYSIYNSFLNNVLLVSSVATVLSIYYIFHPTYDQIHDSLRIEFLLLPTAFLAINHEYCLMEVCAYWFYFKLKYLIVFIVFMEIFQLLGGCCNSSTNFFDKQNWRSWMF